jgi:hypothetical protein
LEREEMKMPDEINKFAAALAEIEKGIGILSRERYPDQKRIEWWTREAAKLREQIAQENANNGKI